MKWKKWLALLMAAVMTLSMAACTKDAGSAGSAGTEGGSNESSGEKDSLVLGTSADFAPYEYHKMIDGKDTILGFDVALARQIAEDMGKPAQFLKAIKQPPFYGIHRHIGLSTIIHGVNVNKDMQVLNAEGAPIEGLYAIGNCAGNFFGSPDYPMTVPGLSLGRCHTQGYVVGRAVASK